LTSVAFIGVGRLGRHLAASLLRAGFELAVHDHHEGATAPLVVDGARFEPSPAAAARGADVVVTCLPSPAAVAAVVEDEDGVLTTLRRGGVWIDMSTNDRSELLRLAALAEDREVATVEAPVTGGVHLAATGEITIFLGGDRDVVDAQAPLFEAMGGRRFYLGELGAASELKVITNMLAFVHLVACGDALMLAKRAGLELAQAHEAIAASSGTSFVHETEGQVILNGSYDIGFTIDLALKDLDLVLARADESGVPLNLAAMVRERFAEARERYGGAAWSPRIVQLLEDEVGEELRAPGFPASLDSR